MPETPCFSLPAGVGRLRKRGWEVGAGKAEDVDLGQTASAARGSQGKSPGRRGSGATQGDIRGTVSVTQEGTRPPASPRAGAGGVRTQGSHAVCSNSRSSRVGPGELSGRGTCETPGPSTSPLGARQQPDRQGQVQAGLRVHGRPPGL